MSLIPEDNELRTAVLVECETYTELSSCSSVNIHLDIWNAYTPNPWEI